MSTGHNICASQPTACSCCHPGLPCTRPQTNKKAVFDWARATGESVTSTGFNICAPCRRACFRTHADSPRTRPHMHCLGQAGGQRSMPGQNLTHGSRTTPWSCSKCTTTARCLGLLVNGSSLFMCLEHVCGGEDGGGAVAHVATPSPSKESAAWPGVWCVPGAVTPHARQVEAGLDAGPCACVRWRFGCGGRGGGHGGRRRGGGGDGVERVGRVGGSTVLRQVKGSGGLLLESCGRRAACVGAS